MAVIETALPSDAKVQTAVHNQNIGGELVAKSLHTIPSGAIVCVVGCQLAPLTTASDITNTIVPAWNALAEVNEVNGDQHMGMIPTEQLDPALYPLLSVSAQAITEVVTIPPNRSFSTNNRFAEYYGLPLDEIWMTAMLEVPEFLTGPVIQALETALKTVAEVQKVKHLFDGQMDQRVVTSGQMSMTSQVRFEDPEQVGAQMEL